MLSASVWRAPIRAHRLFSCAYVIIAYETQIFSLKKRVAILCVFESNKRSKRSCLSTLNTLIDFPSLMNKRKSPFHRLCACTLISSRSYLFLWRKRGKKKLTFQCSRGECLWCSTNAQLSRKRNGLKYRRLLFPRSVLRNMLSKRNFAKRRDRGRQK